MKQRGRNIPGERWNERGGEKEREQTSVCVGRHGDTTHAHAEKERKGGREGEKSP